MPNSGEKSWSVERLASRWRWHTCPRTWRRGERGDSRTYVGRCADRHALVKLVMNARKKGGRGSKDRWQIDACPLFHLESAPGNANDVSVSRRVSKPPP